MNKFYTQTGDDGFTNLLGEGRVEKYHARIEAVGTIDEASAALGFARRVSKNKHTDELLLVAQRDLYLIMAEVAATTENAERFRKVDQTQIDLLEKNLDKIGSVIEIPSEFIIPGDTLAGAAIAIARTIVRRAERRVSLLLISKEIDNPFLLRYLNRLSSLCFALELYESQVEGQVSPTLAKT